MRFAAMNAPIRVRLGLEVLKLWVEPRIRTRSFGPVPQIRSQIRRMDTSRSASAASKEIFDRRQRANGQKPDSRSGTRTRPGLRIVIVAKMKGKPIMTPGYVTANFAIKAGYFFVGALVLIFVGMLVLTAVHP